MAFRPMHIFLGAVLIALVAQTVIWHERPLADERYWMQRTQDMHADLAAGPIAYHPARHPTHPGTPLLLVSVAARTLGVSAQPSLYGSTILIHALLVGGIVYTAFRLRPTLPFWLGMGVVSLTHPFYLQLNPLDIIASSALVLIFLLLLQHLESPNRNRHSLIPLGLLVGFGLAVRLHIILAALIVPALMLISTIGWRRLMHAAVAAGATAFALIPFMWHTPLAYLWYSILQPIQRLVQFSPVAASATNWDYMPHAVAGLGIGLFVVGILIFKHLPAHESLVVRTLLGATLASLIVVLAWSYSSIRFIVPIAFVWEAFLLLFVLAYVKKKAARTTIHPWHIALAYACIIFLFIQLQIGVWWYATIPQL